VRIAWFTPLSSETGVARYSVNVVRALSTLADVEVWAEPRDDNLTVDGCANRELTDPASAARATSTCDLRVYNMGNNASYHQVVYQTYGHAPGLMILHDKLMQNYFYESASHAHYVRLMTYLYGDQGVEAAGRALANAAWLSDGGFLNRFPLIEACLWNAHGVLTHSRHSADAVGGRYGALVPVESVQLPLCTIDVGPEGGGLFTRADLGVPSDTCLVVATGRISRGKCIETVLEAFAASDCVRSACRFVAVGGAAEDYLAEMRLRAEELGLSQQVEFVTAADEKTMQSYLEAADICVNLRYPSTESASATLVEQLHHGKPVVVYDIGVYAEQPDELVVKVAVGDGAEGVARALIQLVEDPARRARIGEAAAAYAAQNCSPTVFAERFLAFAERVVASRSTVVAVDEAAAALRSVRRLAELRHAARDAAERLLIEL